MRFLRDFLCTQRTHLSHLLSKCRHCLPKRGSCKDAFMNAFMLRILAPPLLRLSERRVEKWLKCQVGVSAPPIAQPGLKSTYTRSYQPISTANHLKGSYDHALK